MTRKDNKYNTFCENVPIKMTIFITDLLTNFSNSDLALSYNGLKITTQIIKIF